MKFFTPILCAIALFLVPSISKALDKHRIFRARIVCADHIQCGRAVRLFHKATKYIHEAVDVDIRIVAVERTDKVIYIGDYHERLMAWADLIGKKEDLTFVIVGAFPNSKYLDMVNEVDTLGIVESIGGLGRQPVIGMARLIGGDELMTKLLIHEIGHLMGATHISLGIMAPSVQENQYTECYAIETIKQIKEYMNSLP